MRKYLYGDQTKIEDALRELAKRLWEEVGVCAATVKMSDHGDIDAEVLVDEDGSVFHMEITCNGNRVVKEHLYLPGASFLNAVEGK